MVTSCSECSRIRAQYESARRQYDAARIELENYRLSVPPTEQERQESRRRADVFYGVAQRVNDFAFELKHHESLHRPRPAPSVLVITNHDAS